MQFSLILYEHVFAYEGWLDWDLLFKVNSETLQTHMPKAEIEPKTAELKTRTVLVTGSLFSPYSFSTLFLQLFYQLILLAQSFSTINIILWL